MRLLNPLLFLLGAATTLLATDNGLTTAVTWDQYSLLINNERVWIFAGEFHYERLPVPELWRDVLQKFKANGLNAVNTYFFWSYHSASRGVLDFETAGKDVQRLFDIAREEGLWVVARPGPYVNAETSAGGLALWTTDGSGGEYRTADERFYEAWLPWITEMGKIIARNQITEGGPVIMDQIENELTQNSRDANDTLVRYMEQIQRASRDAGIVVPFNSNEKNFRGPSWTTDFEPVGDSAVDLYGLDDYPGALSCSDIEAGFHVEREYYQWFQNYSYTQPNFWPEFEGKSFLGGWFNQWGGYFYDECIAEHDPAFPDVFYKNNIGQNGALLSIYMTYGGTNWGNLAAPVVYTSYDYSAPLRETREVQLKFKQEKLVALFTRVSEDLRKTDMESNGTGNAVSSDDIWTWVLRNPDNDAGFYVLQHKDTSSRKVTDFSIHLDTSVGPITVDNVQLNGRQSKIVTTDYHFGDNTMLYCTADIAVYGFFEVPVMVLYLEAGQVGEFAFRNKGSDSDSNFKVHGDADVTSNPKVTSDDGSSHFTKYRYTQSSGSTVVELAEGVLVYLLEKETAWNFFAPSLTANPVVKPDEQVFVLGPYNVRNVSVSDGVVTLVGDNANTTRLEVYAGSGCDRVVWNGKTVNTQRSPYGSLIGEAPGATDRNVELPELSWVGTEAFPERYRNYDDSAWVVCNKTSTLNPTDPLTLPVLYSPDYGYYSGAKIYRGYFDGKEATSANITAQGGDASGFSAWLNGEFAGVYIGNATEAGGSALLDFHDITLHDTDNVLTVVTDFTGFDQMNVGPSGGQNPRGILGAWLYGNDNSTLNFTRWKIQGNAGGDANIDPVRGPMNEDGLHGTRVGWHLPGYQPDDTFTATSPLEGLNASGLHWYISHFDLDLDADLDVPLGLQLTAPNDTTASLQFYVNGYQYGKYMPHLGPQTRFPFPPGVVNNRGRNTLALSPWAQTEEGASLDKVELIGYNVFQTGFDFNQDWEYLQPAWDEARLRYA
ncbi:hypothetical protein MBLNU230_g2373t1 [Neophaeotheca triangularis]